jgi:hypothetical protein
MWLRAQSTSDRTRLRGGSAVRLSMPVAVLMHAWWSATLTIR